MVGHWRSARGADGVRCVSDLLPLFIAACERLDLPASTTPVVLAVSGGADSMALWDLAVRAARWPLVVWHLDHGLRADAHVDAELIQARAEAYASAGLVPGELRCERTDVAALAADWRCSIETAGRRYRYVRLALVASECRARVVCTAHHRDDQSETVLFNLLRGAGPVGMAGIPARRRLAKNVAVVRPLLGFRRTALRDYLNERALTWHEDSTNTDTQFTRNRLRLDVLSGLEAGVPGISEALAILAEQSRRQVTDDEERLAVMWEQVLGSDDVLLEPVLRLSERLRLAFWRRVLEHLQIPVARHYLRRLDDLARGAPGRRATLGVWMFARSERVISWESSLVRTTWPDVRIVGVGEYRRGHDHLEIWHDVPPSDPRGPSNAACLDVERCAWPLEWRLARRGERWQALGSPGSQTIARWLMNRGVSVAERRSQAVIADANGVVWIPGHTIAERCRIHAGTTQVLRLDLSSRLVP